MALKCRLTYRKQRVVGRRVSVLVVFAVVAVDLHRRAQQERAEEEEHPTERIDHRCTERNEDAAKDERQDDADQQRELLQRPGNHQLGHDHDEDEQVVDREAVLGNPAGKELPCVARAGDSPDTEAEHHRQGDVDADEEAGLLHRRFVRAAADQESTSMTRITAITPMVMIQA